MSSRRVTQLREKGRKGDTRKRSVRGISTRVGGAYPRSADGDTYTHRLRGWDVREEREIGRRKGEGGYSDEPFSEKRMKCNWKGLTFLRRTKIYCFGACSRSFWRKTSVVFREGCTEIGHERNEKASTKLGRR